MRFTACTNPNTRPQNEIPPDQDSDANGDVFWMSGLNWGGADPCQVDLLVQGELFWSLPPDPPGGVRSPDNDSDGLVALSDLHLWQQAFVGGGPPWRGDLAQPFDDLIALFDLMVFQAHFVLP